MTSLPAPDCFHLQAAEGWLELGDTAEALADLDKIAPELQEHPLVLEIRWQILAKRVDWATCAEVARTLTTLNPGLAFGWIHLAYATRRMPGGSLDAAWAVLAPTVHKFPQEPLIPYNLSCYAAQLGKLDEAREWLEQALATAKKVNAYGEFRTMALHDSDLVALREEIAKLPATP